MHAIPFSFFFPQTEDPFFSEQAGQFALETVSRGSIFAQKRNDMSGKERRNAVGDSDAAAVIPMGRVKTLQKPKCPRRDEQRRDSKKCQ